MTVQVDYRTVTPKVDKLVYVEGWKFGVRLLQCEWDQAQFRIESQTGIKPAINITITGRTPQRYQGIDVVKCKIEFVGDGEPSTFSSGWIELDAL